MKSALALSALPVALAVALTVHLLGVWPAVVLVSAVAFLVGVGVLIGVALDKPLQRDLGYDEGDRHGYMRALDEIGRMGGFDVGVNR